jgi:hypothetical protein
MFFIATGRTASEHLPEDWFSAVQSPKACELAQAHNAIATSAQFENSSDGNFSTI